MASVQTIVYLVLSSLKKAQTTFTDALSHPKLVIRSWIQMHQKPLNPNSLLVRVLFSRQTKSRLVTKSCVTHLLGYSLHLARFSLHTWIAAALS